MLCSRSAGTDGLASCQPRTGRSHRAGGLVLTGQRQEAGGRGRSLAWDRARSKAEQSFH